jgi:protein-tyrosine phosphatase
VYFEWVIDGVLIRTQRPGYKDESGGQVRQTDVDAWMEEAKRSGVNSIICLLAEDQLPFYTQLPGGLIEYYSGAGFNVSHVPAKDHQWPPLNDVQLEQVWEAHRDLPKPVLIHCSAGVDRTGAAVRHIQKRLQEVSAGPT